MRAIKKKYTIDRKHGDVRCVYKKDTTNKAKKKKKGND